MKQLLAALKNNNKPQPNAGLSTVLAFSSPSNPITQREPEFFFGMMQNSQYSLLLGRFDTFRVVGTEDLSNTGAGYGAETVAVFDFFDIDSSGVISMDEFHGALYSAAIPTRDLPICFEHAPRASQSDNFPQVGRNLPICRLRRLLAL